MEIPTRLLGCASLLVMVLVGACSSDGNGALPVRSGAISLRGLSFVPAVVTIASGGSVTWTDDEEVEHTVTAGMPGAPDKARFHKVLLKAETFSFTFDEPGAYAYFCERHPANMQGKVTVR